MLEEIRSDDVAALDLPCRRGRPSSLR